MKTLTQPKYSTITCFCMILACGLLVTLNRYNIGPWFEVRFGIPFTYFKIATDFPDKGSYYYIELLANIMFIFFVCFAIGDIIESIITKRFLKKVTLLPYILLLAICNVCPVFWYFFWSHIIVKSWMNVLLEFSIFPYDVVVFLVNPLNIIWTITLFALLFFIKKNWKNFNNVQRKTFAYLCVYPMLLVVVFLSKIIREFLS